MMRLASRRNWLQGPNELLKIHKLTTKKGDADNERTRLDWAWRFSHKNFSVVI